MLSVVKCYEFVNVEMPFVLTLEDNKYWEFKAGLRSF